MPQSMTRLALFLAGLFTLLSWELAAPDHQPTASRTRRWLGNLALAAVNGGIVSLLCAVCAVMALQRWAPWRNGAFEALGLPTWLRPMLELLVLDAVVYLLHRAYHRIPVLWRFHQVHHTDLDLDVTSASRFHAGEVLVSSAAKLVVVALLGISPLGLVAFETAMLLAAQFQHANVSVPASIERGLWWVLVPPAMHRIHHHPVQAATDSNFGTILPLWDRLFGTFRRGSRSEAIFGLPEYRDERRLSFPALLTMPFKSRFVAQRGMPYGRR